MVRTLILLTFVLIKYSLPKRVNPPGAPDAHNRPPLRRYLLGAGIVWNPGLADTLEIETAT